MKSVTTKVLIALVMVVTLGAVQTASAEGPLPLKAGVYVLANVPCDHATNADRIDYGGSGDDYWFSVPHTDCKITRVRNKGNVYYITQRCEYKGVKGIITDHWTISVKSPTSFSIINYSSKGTIKKGSVYRWCQE